MEIVHDVIVVGGGPVGCYTASLLAQKGFDILVLEGNPIPGHRVICTGLLGAETFKRFALPTSSIINEIQDVTFVSPSGIRFSYRPGSPRAFLADRRRFDGDMAAMAVRHGATLACDSLVKDIRIREEDVAVAVEGPDGISHLQAKVVVLACGFNPELTAKIGLGSPTDCLNGGQVELDLDGVTETEVYVGRNIAPESFAWVVPINSEKARIGLTTREDAEVCLRSFLRNPMIRNRIRSDKAEIRTALIPIRPIRKSYATRAVVVGEAAGQVKATTCGGIYYGLISATCAAETIDDAFRQGRFDDASLKTYEQRWRHELEGELEVGYRFRQIFSLIGDKQIDRLFETLNSDGISPLIHRMAKFDWHKDLILTLSKHGIFRKYLEPLSAFAKGHVDRESSGSPC